MPEYIPVITAAGMAAALAAESGGFAVNITHVALGETGYTVAVNGSGLATATHLITEHDRVAIQHAQEIAPGQTDISFVVNSASEYFVREVGFFLADGTLFAVASSPTVALMWKSALTQAAIAFELVLEAVNPSSVTIISTGPPLELLLTAERARLTALENGVVYTTGNQNVDGIKTMRRVRLQPAVGQAEPSLTFIGAGNEVNGLYPVAAGPASIGGGLRLSLAGAAKLDFGYDNILRGTDVSTPMQIHPGMLQDLAMPGLKANSGWQRMPNGLIIQWGIQSVSATTAITFPISFPTTAMWAIAAGFYVDATRVAAFNVNSLTLTGMTINQTTVTGGPTGWRFFAIGF